MRSFLLCGIMALSGVSCSNMTPEQQANLNHALTVGCMVDGVVQPISNMVVGTLGPAGAASASADALLVHPVVVAECAKLNGTPVAVVAPAPVVGPVAGSSPISAGPAK